MKEIDKNVTIPKEVKNRKAGRPMLYNWPYMEVNDSFVCKSEKKAISAARAGNLWAKAHDNGQKYVSGEDDNGELRVWRIE